MNAQRENRRLAQRERMRVRRANESTDQKNSRLASMRNHIAEMRANESENEHSQRVEANQEAHLNETEPQRLAISALISCSNAISSSSLCAHVALKHPEKW